MTLNKNNNHHNKSFLLVSAAAAASVLMAPTVSAFSGAAVVVSPTTTAATTTFQGRIGNHKASVSLPALIYGWDGDDDVTDSDNLPDILKDNNSVGFGDQCSPVGTAVAEKLSFDPDSAGHLARLAVAFSPPDRALNIKDIEHVDVVCVREDSIEIQAVICGGEGCVSLAVPVKYPRTCQAESGEHLEGCVLQNLNELNQQAQSTLSFTEAQQNAAPQDASSLEDLYNLNNAQVQYPDWWISPDSNAALVEECEFVKGILNEAEFAPDVLALAQDAMKDSNQQGEYVLQRVRCAMVGPAGIAFKAIAQCQSRNASVVLDVMYPFGGQPQMDANSLRAAVLGAVAAAEGQ